MIKPRGAYGLLWWGGAALAILLYLHLFDWPEARGGAGGVVHWDGLVSTAGRVSTHWPLALMTGLILLIVSGQLGADLGVPLLFRDERMILGRKSRMFWGSLGSTLMVAQFWTIVYILQYGAFYDFFPTDPGAPGGALDWATFVRDESGVRLADLRFLRWTAILRFLAVGGPPVLLLLLLSAAIPSPVPGMAPRPLRRVGLDLANCALGIASGVALVVAVVWLENVGRSAVDLTGLVSPFRAVFKAGDIDHPKAGPALIVVTLLFSLIFAGFAAAVACPAGRGIDPSLGVTFVFSLVGIGYFLLASIQSAYQPAVVAASAALLLLANGGAYKYRFPGMGRGVDGRSIYEGRNRVDLEQGMADERVPAGAVGLLDDRAVLEAWAARWRRLHPGLGPPRVVLVAASGGAYRSGFWTGMVLDELARRGAAGSKLEGVADAIRILTGASGGMVGAGYFAALRAAGDPGGSVVEAMTRDTGRDSLRPIVQQMVRRDIPLTGVPLPYQVEDRGTTLDRQWRTMDRPFAGLAEAEADGTCPSLIVAPMIVESGRRMLISNLDVDHLAATWSASGRFYSRSAVQFFRMFPSARAGFKLSTAVRMSATFPYASPAVNLPTSPPRRLVDAGYYDNYGVNLAANWANHHRDWLAENTSGIALIQVHAYTTEGVKKAAGPLVEPAAAEPSKAGGSLAPAGRPADPSARFFARLATGFSWLTTPGEGALSARGWTMSFRNDEQVRALDDHFNAIEPGLFETFVFENPVAFGMNWFLSEHDVDEMTRQIGEGPNLAELERMEAWWNRPRAR